jgi:putative ABC transport system permease protein
MSALAFVPLLLANLRRRRVRTVLTVLSVATAFLLYGLMAALRNALLGGVSLAGADRLITTHKTSIIQGLPRSYLNRIAGTDGVRVATSFGWFGGYFINERNQVISEIADPETLQAVYPEFVISAAASQAWRSQRDCALVGETLARTWQWKIGDRIPLRSAFRRRSDGGDTWELKVCGIYSVTNSGDTNAMFLRYDYYNESVRIGRDEAGWVVFRVRDPARMTEIARRVDGLFANSATETKTSSEQAFAQSWINQIGNVGSIITAIVSAVFFTMLLVTANTMAQSIRERTAELAVMKTLGFTGAQVLGLVLAESVLVTLIGGLLGMGLSTVVVRGAKQALAQYLPMLAIPPGALLSAAGFMLLLGLLSGALPAAQAWRLRIVEALRRT